MKMISITEQMLQDGVKRLPSNGNAVHLFMPKKRGVIDLPMLVNCPERYFIFSAEALTDHSAVLELCLYTNESARRALCIRFNLLPRFETLICLDLNLLDGNVLFPARNPGQLKIVCLGERVEKSDLTRVTLESVPCYCDVEVLLGNMRLADEPPESFPIPDVKLVDIFGQYKGKDWPSKIHDEQTLTTRLNAALSKRNTFAFPDWTEAYGGCKSLKLTDGTGFFGKARHNNRWFLVDPQGYAFFSLGVDCVTAQKDCRIDNVETLMDWLPAPGEPCCEMYNTNETGIRGKHKQFSFAQSNLHRAFGVDWYEKWLRFMPAMLKDSGINTIGNWSDDNLFDVAEMPYVTQLPKFPDTAVHIFRDFPDVLSEEYKKSSITCAETLRARKDDPYMIGYFLRNEPNWAFVDRLILADEVLRCPAETCCKAKLIEWLATKYIAIDALNDAWGRTGRARLTSFAALTQLHLSLSADSVQGEAIERKVSSFSEQALADMRAFSRILLDAYVSIPTQACRAADPNHMVLGMRWAWVSSADLIVGWENFDVFSINCYAANPIASIDRVVGFGVDLPVLVGEFHFGALDGGLPSTGLLGVQTQKDRGIAYRHYAEHMATHPHGVGCHYFQCYDQFVLGRSDGENFNIGLFDICSQPYPDQLAAMRLTGEAIYGVMQGAIPAYAEEASFIPVVAL